MAAGNRYEVDNAYCGGGEQCSRIIDNETYYWGGGVRLSDGAELDLGRFSEVDLHPEQRLRLQAKVRVMPTKFDGHSHPFELIAVPDSASGLQPLSHPSVFYVPEK